MSPPRVVEVAPGGILAVHPGGEGGLANPPGSSLAFQVYCGNQQGLFLDQELFMCLWQPSQSKTLPDGHNTQQPRPPRAVRLFPACKNNKQLPVCSSLGSSSPVLHVSVPGGSSCAWLRLDHVAGDGSQKGWVTLWFPPLGLSRSLVCRTGPLKFS